MSVLIETTEELLVVLKKLGIKVANVDELRGLLASINANYNPDAARTRTAKLVGISVPCTLAAVAGLVSVVLTERANSGMLNPSLVGALAVVWSACALVSVTALIFSFVLLARRRSAPAEDKAVRGTSSRVEQRSATGITPDLTL
jgi:hypothetical protein